MENLEPSHSEPSSIPATSKKSPPKDDKNKEKAEVGSNLKHEQTSSRCFIRDLKLVNDDEVMNKGNPNSKLDHLNLFTSSNAIESSNEGTHHKPLESKTFTCNFCTREFSTCQALGGHQNAHKKERTLAKHLHDMADTAQVPFYGTSNRSLGVRVNSMIHKPYPYHPSWPSSSYQLGLEKMSRAHLISSPSTSYGGRLRTENFESHQISGSGSGRGKFGATLKLGVNPNPIADYNACNAARTEANEGNKNQRLRLGNVDDGCDQTDASGLDLNLKL